MTVSFVSGPGEEGNNDIDFWVTPKMMVSDIDMEVDSRTRGKANRATRTPAKWRLLLHRG